ncbi:hypothetical protein N5D48_16990 [Pseudomonas sp. GD03858]|uniref:hypothetical protein n=1 Tax=unclassified Pseudomonas TaxID=196821 RepID=UPI00244B8D49|nr:MULTISPECIES: hypothetical protein [unclassified Pseudomonas]MDH0650198.1 hypothetical protein [Pseudomonas sp. GD03867]MDH0664104.1 hypothetical protein [Pseudomonas sp. GD03858]
MIKCLEGRYGKPSRLALTPFPQMRKQDLLKTASLIMNAVDIHSMRMPGQHFIRHATSLDHFSFKSIKAFNCVACSDDQTRYPQHGQQRLWANRPEPERAALSPVGRLDQISSKPVKALLRMACDEARTLYPHIVEQISWITESQIADFTDPGRRWSRREALWTRSKPLRNKVSEG